MSTKAHKTPVELATMYIERVYENHEYELVREIFSDPMIRHDPNGIVVLSHEEQIARLEKYQAQMGANFHNVTVHGDDEYVTAVYDMWTTRGKPYQMCSIETWRVQDGLITDCWNSPYVEGKWGDPDRPETLQPKTIAPKIIRDSEHIDREWLTHVFAEAKVTAPRVELVSPTPLTGGNAAKTLRLAIDYNAEPGDAPQSLVCKMTPDNPHMAYMLMQGGANVAEVNAARLFSDRQIINAPKLYFGATDEHGFCFNLLVEDLGQKGCYEGDQIKGLSIQQAEAVCDQLARLHSHFWNVPQLDEFSWLQRSAQSSADAYLAGVQVARDYFGELLTEQQYQTIDAFADYVDPWFNYSDGNETIVHVDARSANILFCPTGNGDEDAYLIDWQTVSMGNPMRDMAYFLGVSVATGNRRKIERRLLKKHTEAITAKDANYSLDAALEAYRFNLFAGVWGAVATCAYAHTDELREVLFSWLPRSLAAVEDWDSLSLLLARLGGR